MFQSFKKWVKNEDVEQCPTPPPGMQLMKGDLQRKFAKGVQYNMKIVIRGDRNTGKSCLLHRLKGHRFLEEYIPTAEIQVASIHWDYKATDDIVKVDVWDVVDEGRSKKKESKGLKISGDIPAKEALEQQVLDATFLDVYKHAHAVIMMFDITKKWTFGYIERELPKVPTHIPVLVLANFTDMGDHRVITVDQAESLIESCSRPPGSPSVMFCETSLKNGFGLKYIHKFFNMPFLLVQRESLLKQLETNHLDLESCVEELITEEYSYNDFLRTMQNARKKVPAQPEPTSKQQTPEKSENNKAEPQASRAPPTSLKVNTKSVQQNKQQQQQINTPGPSGREGLFSPSQMQEQPSTSPRPEPERRGFMSRFFRRASNEPAPAQTKKKVEQRVPDNKLEPKPVTNVEEFVPDEGSVDDFLNEIPEAKERRVTNVMESSDEDENTGNPMVAGFQEDLDSDDQVGPSFKETAYSSSESEQLDFNPVKKPSTSTKKTTSAAPVFKKVSGTPPPSLNIDASANFHAKEISDFDDDMPSPRTTIMQDADSSSDDNFPANKTDFEVMSPKSSENYGIKSNGDSDKGTDLRPVKTDFQNSKYKSEETVQKDSESDDDVKANTMVSAVYDDISSNDESTPHPPIAIVSPLQAERKIPLNDEDETDSKPKSGGLNLELSSADLSFLEQTANKQSPSDERISSKDGKGHRSKKSSSRRSEEDGSSSKKSHRKHKKHRSKNSEERDLSKTEDTKAHRTKEDGERRKKKKTSRDSEPSSKLEKADNDLEAFLSGC